jgi:hypothetical protein
MTDSDSSELIPEWDELGVPEDDDAEPDDANADDDDADNTDTEEIPAS